MSETLRVQFELLRTEALRFAASPYLLTVTDAGRPYCVATTVEWEARVGTLHVPAPSNWSGSAAQDRRPVTVLWPPMIEGGYSLIVDGVASATGKGDDGLVVTPTRAVLHRPGRARAAKPGCASDCIPILTT